MAAVESSEAALSFRYSTTSVPGTKRSAGWKSTYGCPRSSTTLVAVIVIGCVSGAHGLSHSVTPYDDSDGSQTACAGNEILWPPSRLNDCAKFGSYVKTVDWTLEPSKADGPGAAG